MLPASAPERGARDAAILETLASAFDALANARAERRRQARQCAERADRRDQRLVMTASQARRHAARGAARTADRAAQGLLRPASSRRTGWRRKWRCSPLRADVREELDRLAAHVQEARALLASGDAVGRKLDFLAQEFNREANTLCSKSVRHPAHAHRPRAQSRHRPVPRAGAERGMKAMGDGQMKRRGLMLVLSSPSGAGKTTLSRKLLESDPPSRCRCRPRRANRAPTKSKATTISSLMRKEFEHCAKADAFLEHATVFENRYGTPKEAGR